MVADMSLMEVVLPNEVKDKVDLLGSIKDKITQRYCESVASRSKTMRNRTISILQRHLPPTPSSPA